ncbi:MAG: family 43 glycosylhydrolase [Prevotella sp.]|nr:family 43 glycosylhydrolase [Prevotella sp.]MBQ5455557.1 family 43 glycosylhydrolase [Prevotella sp.]
MKLKIILGTVFMCVSMGVEAQTISRTYKTVSNGNPISPCVFCADPTALEYDGRLYVYGSNDSQQFVVNNKQGNNGYGAIKSLVVFSTDDMVNWTFHGTIDVGKLCSSWGWRFAASWAPSVTWRVGANGKDEFFLYFANSGGSVGVLTANSPIGPWKSPLSKPLIDGDTPGVAPCNWIFDPGVVIDDNGTGWIAFGGGDPNSQGTKLMPGNSRIAKLKSSMIALDGKAVNLPAPYLFEASELNMMNGRYVYTYNTSWSDRNDWNSYAKRGSYPSPSSCSMCYMVTDDPLNPNAWEYKGEYVPNPGNFGFGWGNNHTHLQKFQGNYYLFYHSMVLEQNMNTGASGFRSIGVEKVTVNESKQQINKVTMTNQGPAAIKKMDPYSLQQAETMSTSGGINYEDFSNIVKVTTLNGLGNDASKNLQVKMNKGAWTMVRNVDFGSEGANSFTLRTKGTGKLEIRLDNPNAKAAATVEFSSSVFLNHTVSVDPTLFKGVKKIFFMFMEATNVYFDSWQFSLEQPSGIQPFVSAEKTPSAVYDLSGRKHLSNQGLKSGVYIRDGKKVVVK